MSDLSIYTQEQLAFCKALPKVELHAHLNGSIRESTIRFVYPTVAVLQYPHGGPCPISFFFACRELAHSQGLSADTLAFLSKSGA